MFALSLAQIVLIIGLETCPTQKRFGCVGHVFENAYPETPTQGIQSVSTTSLNKS